MALMTVLKLPGSNARCDAGRDAALLSDGARHTAAIAGRRSAVPLVVGVCALMMAGSASGAESSGKTVGRDRFLGHYWSQSRPNLHFEYGCDTGWHSFSFRADGYFLYDRKTAGSWSRDHLGNVLVITNQGERLLLLYDGGIGLSQLQRSNASDQSVFGREYRQYRQCETGS